MKNFRSVNRAIRRGHVGINSPIGTAGQSVLYVSVYNPKRGKHEKHDYPAFGRYTGNKHTDSLILANAQMSAYPAPPIFRDPDKTALKEDRKVRKQIRRSKRYSA